MVTTNNKKIADIIKRTRAFGYNRVGLQSSLLYDVYLLGSALKYNISKSTSINLEYYYRITEKDGVSTNQNQFYNSLSLGLDIETGGHVFQLHITNSLPMYEVGFLTETNQSWMEGGIHFGFNISREFTLKWKD